MINMLILSMIFFVLSRVTDVWTTQRAISLGATEKKGSLFRGDNGQFRLVRYIILYDKIGVLCTLASLYDDYGWVSFWAFILPGFIVSLINYQNGNRMKK